jgi:hypothetical protein
MMDLRICFSYVHKQYALVWLWFNLYETVVQEERGTVPEDRTLRISRPVN